PAVVAGRRGEGGEIAGKHRCSGNVGDRIRRSGSLDRVLIAAEKEQLVFLDRTADNSAELVALQRVAGSREEVAGVKDSVSQKFEQVAVKLIRAGLGDGIDCRRSVNTILRREGAGFHLEFLQRIREG